MDQMDISFGRNRSDTKWKPEYLEWSEFVERLQKVRRTNETMAQYDKMANPKKGKIKDGPAFVGGLVRGGRRKKENVESRCLITSDIDHADEHFPMMVDLVLGGTAYVLYSTHSHRPEKPKYRLVIPVSRPMLPDEYAAVSRKLAGNIGLDYFDKTTFDIHRLMYLPSCSKDAEPVLEIAEGEPLDVDAVLAEYDDWRDSMQWPRHEGDERHRETKSRMEDPREKRGVVGVFCRMYTISEAIDKFLSEKYEVVEDAYRYTYVGSSSYGGLVIYDEDTFAYSHHESDPISGREVNAFDLVRLHLFRDLDDKAKATTRIDRLPSQLAMEEFAANDPMVKRERLAEVKDDFDDVPDEEDDSDWQDKLKVHSKTGMPFPTAANAELILRNGDFKNALAYDDFGNSEVIRKPLPWRDRKRPHQEYEPWLGADDKRMMHYFGKKYEFKAAATLQNAFMEVVHANTFHPIKEYLESLYWDGVERVDRLFVTYLGADDSHYVRSVTRKSLVAACKRLYQPGCKFDEMPVLVGPQGAGKSSLLAKIGRKWFSDSLRTFENKEAGEHLQSAWIFEVGELSAMKKSEVEEIKAFLSKTEDRYRVAYDRQVSEFPRKCIFYGTTNTHAFLRDATGNRRFWPVTIDPDRRELSHWEHLTDEIVGQIWAEALYLFKAGEPVSLDRDAATVAERMQGLHMEEDPREGLILKYLDTPLPDNWDEMELWNRRDYLNEEPAGDIQRTRVSAAEIWAEALGQDPNKFGVWEARPIYDILRKLPEWDERRKGRLRLPIYGLQTLFIRK